MTFTSYECDIFYINAHKPFMIGLYVWESLALVLIM